MNNSSIEQSALLPSSPPTKPKAGKLFSSYPVGTLAALGTGAGIIALFTLLLEVLTGRWLAIALDLNMAFISLPLGLATMIVGLLTARMNVVYALPALILGSCYAVAILVV